MHDAVVTSEIVERDQPHVLVQFAVGWNELFPRTAVKQADIAPSDGVAVLFEQIHKMGADIASMTGDENFHACTPKFWQRVAGKRNS